METISTILPSYYLEGIYLYAYKCHRETNCVYDGHDYSLHINSVTNTAKDFLHLIEDYEQKRSVLIACICHDILEDCNVSYKSLANDIGNIPAADIVYNVTNELGKNREERAEKTYPKIASCKYSTFVKLCDRLSNLRYSLYNSRQTKMINTYLDEHKTFYAALYNKEHNLDLLWQALEDTIMLLRKVYA